MKVEKKSNYRLLERMLFVSIEFFFLVYGERGKFAIQSTCLGNHFVYSRHWQASKLDALAYLPFPVI